MIKSIIRHNMGLNKWFDKSENIGEWVKEMALYGQCLVRLRNGDQVTKMPSRTINMIRCHSSDCKENIIRESILGLQRGRNRDRVLESKELGWHSDVLWKSTTTILSLDQLVDISLLLQRSLHPKDPREIRTKRWFCADGIPRNNSCDNLWNLYTILDIYTVLI